MAVQLAVVDYIILGISMAVSAIVGFYHAYFRAGATTEQLLLANRNMHIIPITLSLFSSYLSAVTVLGVPVDAYVNGPMYMSIYFGHFVTMIVVAFVYLPIFYNLKLINVHQYLEIRFRKRAMKMIGNFTFIVQMLLYLSAVLYAPSLALEEVAGLNLWASVIIIGVLCTLYTSLGGIKAVMWTDVFQSLLMLIGVLAIFIEGTIKEGGFDNVWDAAMKGERAILYDLNPDPRARLTTWSTIIGGFFALMSTYAINQVVLQRALTTPKLKNAQIAFLAIAPVQLLFHIILALIGLVIYAHYKDCDPLKSDAIQARDQIFPYYVLNVLTAPGFHGLFISVIFCATLSTVSSGLNSLAAVTLDLRTSFSSVELSDHRGALWISVSVVFYGIVLVLFSAVFAAFSSILQVGVAALVTIATPLLGLFTLGMFFKQANWKGGVAGWLISLIMVLWMAIGAIVVKPAAITAAPPRSTQGCLFNVTTPAGDSTDTTKPLFYELYRVSYLWRPVISIFLAIIVGVPVSYITGGEDQSLLDPNTVINLREVFCRRKVTPSDQTEEHDANIEGGKHEEQSLTVIKEIRSLSWQNQDKKSVKEGSHDKERSHDTGHDETNIPEESEDYKEHDVTEKTAEDVKQDEDVQ